MDKVQVLKSKHGKNCLWESGGAYANTGFSQVITDGNGFPKNAIHVCTHDSLACGNHALIPVKRGDLIITVSRVRRDAVVDIYRIVDILDGFATLEPLDSPLLCTDGIEAAYAKACDYHCRSPYYVQNLARFQKIKI